MNYLKILGTILICLASSFFGIYKNQKIKDKIIVFIQYKIFLQNIKKQITFYSFSLNKIFENSDDIFSTQIRKTGSCDSIFTQKEDMSSLKLFLQNLGRTDKQEQISNIDNELVYCNSRIVEEQEILKEKAKINLVFYSFIGLAISLILV